MNYRRLLSAFVLFFVAAELWAIAQWPPSTPPDRLSEVGTGVAIVFSPDLALPGNQTLYERLGFVYIETPSWETVIDRLRAHNTDPRNTSVEYLLLETHGTNGHGLKLQTGKYARDERSYISVGALQEALETVGVQRCFLSACNAGRLLRPEIYCDLRPVRDPLFLPATLGIINASPHFDPGRSPVEIFRRRQSNLETLIHGNSSELAPPVLRLLNRKPADKPFEFVVSTMLIQLLTGDPGIELTKTGYSQVKSRADLPRKESERLFEVFLRFVRDVAERERDAARAAVTARAQD